MLGVICAKKITELIMSGRDTHNADDERLYFSKNASLE